MKIRVFLFSIIAAMVLFVGCQDQPIEPNDPNLREMTTTIISLQDLPIIQIGGLKSGDTPIGIDSVEIEPRFYDTEVGWQSGDKQWYDLTLTDSIVVEHYVGINRFFCNAYAYAPGNITTIQQVYPSTLDTYTGDIDTIATYFGRIADNQNISTLYRYNGNIQDTSTKDGPNYAIIPMKLSNGNYRANIGLYVIGAYGELEIDFYLDDEDTINNSTGITATGVDMNVTSGVDLTLRIYDDETKSNLIKTFYKLFDPEPLTSNDIVVVYDYQSVLDGNTDSGIQFEWQTLAQNDSIIVFGGN